MNIVVFVKNLTSGGAEKQSILLAKSLTDHHVVHYIVFNAKFQEPKYIKLLTENPKVKIVAFEGNLLQRFFDFCDYLKANKIDFIFSYLTAANLIAVIASKLSRVKFVCTGIRNAYLPPAKLFVDKILCNHLATKTILNCYSGEQYFRVKGLKQQRMVVIPNCFENISDFSSIKGNADRIKIISVGRFVAQKDYFTALEVIAIIRRSNRNIHYQIVGYGEQEAAIRERIIILNLQDAVSLFINPNNIAQLLDEADLYLSTSIFEGTSNSIMEGMNAGLPIIATNVGDNFKLISEGYNGYLTEVGDVNQIADVVLKLIKNKELLNTMGVNSRRHLEENYSLRKFKDNYLTLISATI